jgi:glycosyltransferase involved in cell wall biosynthesis
MTVDPTSTPDYRAYLRAREAVRRIQANGRPPGTDPSLYWTEELENIDYLGEASPLIVRKLRHHSFHITGIRPYDYRHKGDNRREYFEARLAALRALGGDAPLVPESPAMGGFGYDIDGALYNVDTLKFYEVFVGMKRGGVLDALRGVDRPVVCEVGAGWGGFAYQFKQAFPRTTYVIVDFAELFLYSATYLGALFPAARLLFAGTPETPGLDGWRDADFVFVPHTLSHLVTGLPLDLTVNMVSFQEMTDAQVRGYAAMAAAARCPWLYSLNRERSLYNTELVSVSEALSEWYRLTEIPVLDSDYTGAMKRASKKNATAEASASRYRHIVGRLDPSVQVRLPAESQAAIRSAAPAATPAQGPPRVVLGMTLYNNAANLPQALDSLLAQTEANFALLLLDDASTDGTGDVARPYVERDARVRYVRHDERQAMIATWREVAEMAAREWPDAEYFAWVSDHDYWHPRWLERLMQELDGDAGAVLAYPISRRMSQAGADLQKGPRLFDTAALTDLDARWRYFCREGVGAGDMVYGLMRLRALQRAGVFRDVLRPDRLLMAELTLQGRIRQVPEALWFRRQSNGTSVERQRTTLLRPGHEPRWFFLPPWLQHTLVLWREYATMPHDGVAPLSRKRWIRMLLRYQLTYAARHFRKTDTSHAMGRTINRVVLARKRLKHGYHHAVYNTLVGARALRGRMRRAIRRGLYEALTLTHRLGLRRRHEAPPS